jgi:hypothetical protein
LEVPLDATLRRDFDFMFILRSKGDSDLFYGADLLFARRLGLVYMRRGSFGFD